MRTTVNLTRRADTGTVNSSPASAMAPIVRIQHGCNATIEIPGNLIFHTFCVFAKLRPPALLSFMRSPVAHFTSTLVSTGFKFQEHILQCCIWDSIHSTKGS